jgi:hypothetical protein
MPGAGDYEKGSELISMNDDGGLEQDGKRIGGKKWSDSGMVC